MAGYEDTKQKIISTLMGRPNGTEIQPENHQDYALNMLDYIRSLELIATSTLIGVAESNSTPVQPNDSRVCYIAGVAQNQTVTFENFIGENGNPISVTTGDMEGVFIILMWNTQYWSAQTFSTNIISQSESATFYYRYNIRKTYESIALMNADVASPIGTDGKYIKIGDIVTVVNSTTPSENGIYSYEGATNGWKYQSSFNFQLSQTTGSDPNISMSQKAITNALNLYNVTSLYPLPSGFYEHSTAILAIPSGERILGLIITYETASGAWYTERFIGTDIANWGVAANWEKLPDAGDLAQLRSELSRSIILVDYIDGSTADITKYNIGDYIYMTSFPTKYFYKKTEDLWERVDCKTTDAISFNGDAYIFKGENLEKVFSEVDAIEQKQSIEEKFEKQLYGDNPTFHLVGYLNTEGAFVSNSSFKSTDYIACEQGYYISGIASENPGTCTYAFYDNQKNFLIGHTGPDNMVYYEFKNIEIPVGAAFVRVCAVKSIYAEVEIRPSQPLVELINKPVLVDVGKTLLQPAKVIKGNFIDKNGNYIVNTSHDVNVYVYDDKYNYYIENAAGYVGCCMGWDEEFLGYIPDLWDINPNNLEGRRYPFPIGTAYLFINNSDNSLIVWRTLKTNYDKGYHTCVNKPIDWSGKTAIFFGDSITSGFASVWGGQQFVSDNNYPNLVAAKLNLGEIRNVGIGGSCLAIREAATSNTPGVELIAGTDKKITINEDIIFVAFGTNDCSVEIPIGKIDDMPTSASEARTFFGALNYISNTFDQEYAGKIVVFILPIWRRTYSDKAPLEDYRKAIFAVATSHGYNVVDGSQFGFPADYRKLIADLTHPTELGYKLYAQQLYNELV